MKRVFRKDVLRCERCHGTLTVKAVVKDWVSSGRLRLKERADGLLELRLKTPWRDGTSHLVLSPHELLEKLAAIIPPPKVNLITYHGILASASKHRASVVPGKSEKSYKKCRHSHRSSGWIDWAELMKRVFRKDVLRCERCHGTLTVKAVVKDWVSSGRLLMALESTRARDGPDLAAK